MGLSASQARLLSITARLTDNEYHSQQIANAKMRLAAKGTEARQEYQDALNSKILTYNGFDVQGNAVSTVLTPNVIYQYQPLKNQYSLINNAGRILVNHTDGKNFEETDTIIGFLDRYNVIENYADYTSYQDRYKQYLDDHAAWVEEAAQWEADNAKYQQYLVDYAEWENAQTGDELYDLFAEKIGTSQNPIASCYRSGLNGTADCYNHLLYMLLDYDGTLNIVPKEYDASCDKNGGYDANLRKAHVTQDDYAAMFNNSYTDVMKQVSDCINEVDENGNLIRLCDGDDSYTPDYNNDGRPDGVKENIIQAAIDEGRQPTAVEILMSDYIYDPDTNSVAGIKSLKQKAIDLYYLIDNNMISGKTILSETLINFTEGDMKGISTPEPEFVPEPAELREEPQPPEPPEIKIKDKEKAQWYLNLWCRMNGQKEPPRIQVKEGTDELDEWFRNYVFDGKHTIKDTFEQHYEEIDPYLSSNSTWLEDVLAQGIVVMQRVNSHNTDTQNKFSWDEIIYTDAAELTLETDDNAIAKAEVRYEEKMHEIEIKDKRYQMEINKLDSEHNSLQTQIDSIKSEVSKNIERSYKTFG